MSRRAMLRGAAAAGALAYVVPAVQILTISPVSAALPSGQRYQPPAPPLELPDGSASPAPSPTSSASPSSVQPSPIAGGDGGSATGSSPEPVSGPTRRASVPGGSMSAPANPVSAAGVGLPFTGSYSGVIAMAGGGALLTGAGLMAAGRVRRTPADGPGDAEPELTSES